MNISSKWWRDVCHSNILNICPLILSIVISDYNRSLNYFHINHLAFNATLSVHKPAFLVLCNAFRCQHTLNLSMSTVLNYFATLQISIGRVLKEPTESFKLFF